MIMPTPIELLLHQKSRQLEITFDDNAHFMLPCEYLRVFSPSAEVRGHGHGSSVLQTGKNNVNILRIEPVGNYAVKLVFDDGHSSGLYSWDWLYKLGQCQTQNWQQYLEQLAAAGGRREA
jgi:DUF971 family protein